MYCRHLSALFRDYATNIGSIYVGLGGIPILLFRVIQLIDSHNSKTSSKHQKAKEKEPISTSTSSSSQSDDPMEVDQTTTEKKEEKEKELESREGNMNSKEWNAFIDVLYDDLNLANSQQKFGDSMEKDEIIRAFFLSS